MTLNEFKDKAKAANTAFVVRKYDSSGYERFMIILNYDDYSIHQPLKHKYAGKIKEVMEEIFGELRVLEYDLDRIYNVYHRLWGVNEFPFYERCDSQIERLFMSGGTRI